MLEEPRCSERGCTNFLGVKQDNQDESTERLVCRAFSEVIPDEIAYGNNLHLKPVPGDHGIQFEEVE